MTKIPFLFLFLSITLFTRAQKYINNFSFEELVRSETIDYVSSKLENHDKNVKKVEKFNSDPHFDWFVTNSTYDNVNVISHYDFIVINNINEDDKPYIVGALSVTPAHEGYVYASLKDNFSLHTKLNDLIKKGNKYCLEYFLNKPFMENSANKYFYMSILLSQKEPNIKENNRTQLIQNRIPHSDIKINKSVVYKFEKDKIDTIRIEPRPDLWQKFSIEFVAEDDFEFLGLVRDIKHPQGLTEFMHIDNVQLYLVEDNSDQKKELVNKIDDLAKQIQFETSSSNLTTQSKIILDSLSFYLKEIDEKNSDFVIEINGHTDNEGNKESNLLLSKQRAEIVKLFFQTKKDDKILSLPILTTGFGNMQPLVSNNTDEGKAKNRRVEIKLLNKKAAKNIIFESLSFEEALQKAKKENKLIFIDAYTSWCKPCKLMDRDVFTDSMVAQVFNEKFINLKIDMESEMGKPLNTKYEIQGYPTFLFVDFEGNLTYSKLGFLNAIELTNLGKEIEKLKQEKNINQNKELEKRLYEKAKTDYATNPCKLDFTEAYFNLIDEEKKEEIRKVKIDFIKCIESSQDFSSHQVRFLLSHLVSSKNDITYNFYLNNKSKFEKSYGDSLLALESYLEETFFIQETDSIIKQIGKREKLAQQEIEEFEKTVTRFTEFSKKIEVESIEKGFERPIKKGFVDYIIYATAIKFYVQHKQLDKFSSYLIKYNQLEKLESYRDDFFGEINIPISNFQKHTLFYLEQKNKEIGILTALGLIWQDLNDKNYLLSYSNYLTAAKVFFHNKEKQKAQTMVEKAFELKDESFDEEKYNELKTHINQL